MDSRKPIDRWLALGGVAVGIAFYLLPKTPPIIIASSVAIFALLLHLVWNFWWVERSRIRQILSSALLLAGCALLAYICWPHPESLAKFHVIGATVGFNSKLPQQLIANVYIQNDGSDADISATSYGGLAASTSDEKKRRQIIEEVKHNIPTNGDLTFHVLAHEPKWLTVPGPILTDELTKKFALGEMTFYYAGKITVKASRTSALLEYCSFVVGNNLRAILECPAYGAGAH